MRYNNLLIINFIGKNILQEEKRPSKWKSIIVYIIALLFFALDQYSKYWISTTYLSAESKPILSPWLFFTYVTNDGAAFSILKGQMFWLKLVAVVVVIGIIIYERRLPLTRPKLLSVSLGFLLGGAMGNLMDRLRLSYVVDFIDLHYQGHNIWPIFNVADISINIGVGLLFLHYLFQSPKETNEKKSSDENNKEINIPAAESPVDKTS